MTARAGDSGADEKTDTDDDARESESGVEYGSIELPRSSYA